MWNIIDFCTKYKRYFGALLVFVLIILTMAFGTKKVNLDSNPMAGLYQSYEEEQDSDDEIEALIKNYYTCYAQGNTDVIKTLATPLADAEESYIKFYSQYIDSIDVEEIYSKRGIDSSSYLVSVYIEMHYTGVETSAAGLDFFYLATNENGNLYIDNAYSQFSQTNGEYEMDPNVAALIAAYEKQSDFLAIQAEVQQKCNEEMVADETLNSFVNGTLTTALYDWATEYKTNKAALEQAAAEKEAEEAKAAEEAKTAVKVKIKEKINVRQSASSEGKVLGKIDKGTVTTMYALENEKWAKIDYNDSKAYVSAEYIELVDETAEATNDTQAEENDDAQAEDTQDENQDENQTETVEIKDNAKEAESFAGGGKKGDKVKAPSEDAQADQTADAGTKVTLKKTVNVREKASTDSKKVASVRSGEQVTIISTSNGWSKVKYGNKEGYIKSDLLK